MAQAQTQADALRSNTEIPQPAAKGANQPRVIIPSVLVLTADQETALMEHARRRMRTLEDELGRMDFTSSNWVTQATSQIRSKRAVPFMAKRALSHLIYHMQMEWREHMLGGIWAETNIHLPLTRRTVQQQIARAVSYFFGTAPWFSASPKPVQDDPDNQNAQFADKCDRWAKHEASSAGLESVLAETIRLAFIQGEQITKTTHDRRVSYYKTRVDVLIDPTGKPFTAKDGDYVYRSDKFVPQVQQAPQDVPPSAPGTEPPPPDVSQQPYVLQRDMMTPMPPWPQVFGQTVVERRLVHFDGAVTENVNFQDFLCPLTAPDLERAADKFFLYSQPIINLVNRLLKSEWTQKNLSVEEQLKIIGEITHAFPAGSTEGQLPAAQQPNPAFKEAPGMLGRDQQEPEVSLSESYHHMDVDGDGIMEYVVLIMDKQGRVPLYYDYVANVTPDGLGPFTAHVVNKVENRWHGQGQVDTLSHLQHNADLTLSRWNLAQTSAGRVDLWCPQLVKEGDKDPNLRLNWGRSYTKKDPTTPAAQILEPVYLREFKGQDLMQILQLIMQLFTNMSGVSNANDARMAGLDTGQLATGILDIQKSGEELFGMWIQELGPGIKLALSKHVMLTLAHIDGPRVYRFFDYDEGAQKMVQRLGTFTPEDARNLELDFELELTRYKGQEILTQNQGAMATAIGFYQQPPVVQSRVADMARQILRAQKIRNADRVIQPLTMEEAQQAAALKQPQPPGGPPPITAPPPANPTTPDLGNL